MWSSTGTGRAAATDFVAMYKWFLVFRYLFSRARPFAALVVVASSVALLIVIVSVMEGFRTEHQRKIRGTSSDINIASKQYIDLRNSEKVVRILDGIPGVEACAPYVETMVLYRPAKRSWGPGLELRFLKVLDLSSELDVGEFAEYIAAARMEALGMRGLPEDPTKFFTREWVEDGLWKSMGKSKPTGVAIPPPILVGKEALRDLLLPGEVVSLTAYSPTTQLPATQEFTVAGYFKTGIYDLDAKGILMSMKVADEFLGLSNGVASFDSPEETKTYSPIVSGVRVAARPELRGEKELEELRARVEKALDQEEVFFVRTQTWREERASLLQALKVEKALTSFILGITVLFGGFMIFLILTVQVVEKHRDIGVLQSMGVTQWGAAGLFFRMGMTLCVVGTAIGTAYGVGFAYFVNTIQRWIKLLTGLEVFPLTVFYMDEIPVQFHREDLVFIIAPTVVVSLVASLLPAYRAARKKPVDALRCE